jgi:hypothetical protein
VELSVGENIWNSGDLSGENDDCSRELSVGENIWNSALLSGENDNWFSELSVEENIWKKRKRRRSLCYVRWSVY